MVGWVIPTATKDAPGGNACGFPSLVLQLTIDDDEVDARRKLIGLDVSGVVDDGCKIENSDVREKARLQLTASLKMLALGGEGSDLADGASLGRRR